MHHDTPDRSSEQAEPPGPGPLSQSDPDPERARSRAPIWLIVVMVLLVTGFVVLHLTGVIGPGAH